MTAQINDTFTLRNDEYALAGISGGELFDPAAFHLSPVPSCTACWRGFLAKYALLDNRLVLQHLHINLPRTAAPDAAAAHHDSPVGPVLNNVAPAPNRKTHDWFNTHYDNVNLPISYSGGLLIARDFLQELYVHMGFHPAWKYRTVRELLFDDGALLCETDKSAAVKEYRERFAATPRADASTSPSQEAVERFIRDAFARSYFP